MPSSRRSIPDIVQDLWDLLVSYARQETIEPLRNVGRFVAFGVGGMVVMTVGAFFLSMSALRALQTQTGSVFTDTWSWVPYLIVAVALSVLAFVAVRRIGRGDVGTNLGGSQ